MNLVWNCLRINPRRWKIKFSLVGMPPDPVAGILCAWCLHAIHKHLQHSSLPKLLMHPGYATVTLTRWFHTPSETAIAILHLICIYLDSYKSWVLCCVLHILGIHAIHIGKLLSLLSDASAYRWQGIQWCPLWCWQWTNLSGWCSVHLKCQPTTGMLQ